MIRTKRARPIDTGIVQGLRSHWELLLSMTAVAFVGIIAFEPDYGKLQTASDAADFRRVLVDPGHAMAAAGCDIVFAAGYGALGVVFLRVVGRDARLATVGAVLIAAAALFDEAENLLLIANVVRRQTITDGWVNAMRFFGWLKWSAAGLSVLTLAGLMLMRGIRRIQRV